MNSAGALRRVAMKNISRADIFWLVAATLLLIVWVWLVFIAVPLPERRKAAGARRVQERIEAQMSGGER